MRAVRREPRSSCSVRCGANRGRTARPCACAPPSTPGTSSCGRATTTGPRPTAAPVCVPPPTPTRSCAPSPPPTDWTVCRPRSSAPTWDCTACGTSPEPSACTSSATLSCATDFPPLRSLAVRHNLPRERTRFVGRQPDVTAVRKRLETDRLVTLTGIGGCGKTRLAIAAATGLLEQFPDGVFFADLTPVSDPEVVAGAVAAAVGFARHVPRNRVGTARPRAGRLPDDTGGASGPRQLRAPDRRVRRPRRRDPRTLSGRHRARHQPRGTAPARRAGPSDRPTASSGGGRDGDIRRRAAVLRACRRRSPRLRHERGQRVRHRRDLPEARRHPPGDRARGRAGPPLLAAPDRRSARRPTGAVHRGSPRAGAPSVAPRGARLEPRSPRRRGAGGVPPARRVPGQLQPRGGAGRVPRARGPRTAAAAPAQIPDRRRGRRQGHALPDARDRAGLRRREAGGGRRRHARARPPPSPLPRVGGVDLAGAHLPRSPRRRAARAAQPAGGAHVVRGAGTVGPGRPAGQHHEPCLDRTRPRRAPLVDRGDARARRPPA